MGNRKLISRKQLSANDKYNFCPICVKECKSKGQNFFEVLKPVYIYTMLDSIKHEDGTYHEFVDNIYFCDRCKKEIPIDAWRIAYTCRADGSRWNEPPRRTRENVQRFDAE